MITTLDDVPGHTIINFSQKASQHTSLLGFAGGMETAKGDTGSMMRVNTVYLRPGEATTVTDGWCKKFYNGKHLTSLMCGMKVDEAGRRNTAVVTFDVARDQSLPFEAPPGSGKPGEAERSVTSNPNSFQDQSGFATFPKATKIIPLLNGNKVEELSDGTSWVVLDPEGDLLGVRVDLSVMPTVSNFRTVVVRNLPQSDIVNAPQSVRIQVEGGCSSMTYTILGMLPYAGKNGSGLPDSEAATGPENVVRRVVADSLMARVFGVICKKP